MQRVLRALKRSGCSLAVLVVVVAGQSPAAAADPVFLRGDANQDGAVSISDALMLRRYLFNGDMAPLCMEAANADDKEFDETSYIDISDTILLLNHIFQNGPAPSAPYPEPGVDPTPNHVPCEGYQVTPAHTSERDVIRIGAVEASPGAAVEIPVFIENAVEVEALQFALAYDPEVFTPRSQTQPSRPVAFNFVGTALESAFDGVPNPGLNPDLCGECEDLGVAFLQRYPERGVFTVGVIANLIYTGFELLPGPERVAFKIRGTISATAQPGTTIRLDPYLVPPGDELVPPGSIRAELTSRGSSVLVSVLPRLEGGELRIIDEITFFIRGDSNRDKLVDLSDATHVLGYLFLGSEGPRCPDAADADDNGDIEITDAIAILGQLFTGDGTISSPYPSIGRDSTPDDLPECGM